jgi:hypothetical protein
MPHSSVHLLLAAVLAAVVWSVPTDSLAQSSPYPVSRAQPFRVVPAGTLLEIDHSLSKERVKDGIARISLQPTEGFQARVKGGERANIQSTEAFQVIAESKTKLVGRFPRAIILRLSTEGVRIIERDEEIAKMTILHFKPAIEDAMMGGTWKLQPIHGGNYSPPRLNSIELPLPEIPSQPEPKKK